MAVVAGPECIRDLQTTMAASHRTCVVPYMRMGPLACCALTAICQAAHVDRYTSPSSQTGLLAFGQFDGGELLIADEQGSCPACIFNCEVHRHVGPLQDACTARASAGTEIIQTGMSTIGKGYRQNTRCSRHLGKNACSLLSLSVRGTARMH